MNGTVNLINNKKVNREETTNAWTIGMLNNDGLRRRPPPGEVGGAELSAESLPLSSAELAKRRAKDKQS